jgi:hypothetical protein
VQLEIDEQFLSLATGMPAIGQRWSKKLQSGRCPVDIALPVMKGELL